MKLESKHGCYNVGAVFGVFFFTFFVKNFVIHFVMSKKMVRSGCLGLVKHFYLIQTIILTRLLAMVTRHLKNMRFFC